MKKHLVLLCLIFISLYSKGQICSITATQNGTPNTYVFISSFSPAMNNPMMLWNFGDGSSMVSLQPTHTYTQSGNYTVTMSLLDSTNGTTICTSTLNLFVSFCHVVYNQDTTNTSLYYFSDITNAATTQVNWDFGDNSIGNGALVSHQYNVPGIYTVTCNETFNGVNYCSSSVVIQIGSSCSFQLSSPSPNSPSYVKLFTALIPNSTGTVTWDFGDGSPTVTGPVVQKGFGSAGTFNVCMNYISGVDTCNYCYQVTITSGPGGVSCSFTVNQTGNNTFDFIPSNLNSGNTFSFNFGDGITQTTTSIINHTYFFPGTYYICMDEIDSNGIVLCSYCQPIIIQAPTSNCQANFTYTNVGFDAYFINQSIANPMLGAPVAYSWDFGDGGTSTNAFPHHVYNGYGFYNVCLTVTTANCTNTYCNIILIDTVNNPNGSPCSAQFVFTQTAPYQIDAVVLFPGNGYNYSWDFGDGSPLVNQLLTSHAYANPGTYTICLTMSSAFIGCTSFYCDTLTVDSLGNIIYKGISTGFTLQTTTPTILTGLENTTTSNNIQLQPNPAKNSIRLSGSINELKNYVLLNAVGQQVDNGSFTDLIYTIDISKLEQGIYLLEIVDTTDNSKFTSKIQIN
ncbi:MAG: PKD domain-containing protein [Bacteroidota bacterium]